MSAALGTPTSPPSRPVHMPVTAEAAGAEPPRWVTASEWVARWRAEEGA